MLDAMVVRPNIARGSFFGVSEAFSAKNLLEHMLARGFAAGNKRLRNELMKVSPPASRTIGPFEYSFEPWNSLKDFQAPLTEIIWEQAAIKRRFLYFDAVITLLYNLLPSDFEDYKHLVLMHPAWQFADGEKDRFLLCVTHKTSLVPPSIEPVRPFSYNTALQLQVAPRPKGEWHTFLSLGFLETSAPLPFVREKTKVAFLR